MTRRRLSRRLQRGLALAGAAVTLAAAALFLRGGRVAPYTPGVEAATSEEITHDLARATPSGAPKVAWTEAAAAAGIRFRHFHGVRSTQLPEDMGSGAAWGDYDGDGDPDLYLVNESGPVGETSDEEQSSPARAALYENEGNGHFRDVTEAASVGVRGMGMGAAWGDADGDGDLDLIVTRYGANVLLRNDGHGTFTDVSRESGIDGPRGFWTGVAWGDYDRDGRLDLYVCGYVRYGAAVPGGTSQMYDATVPSTLNPSSYAPERNLLWHNEGGTPPRFTEVAKAAGVDNDAGRSLSAAWADFDGDLWPDIYVANDISDNAMYRNKGDGTFEDVSHSAWVADYRGAMGLGIGDWDGDGDPDIFITHWIAQENALYVNQRGAIAASAKDPLHFTDEADLSGLGQIGLDFVGWGTDFLDYDMDGRLDLFAVNGSTFQREDDTSKLVPMKNQLFWNGGKGKGFFEVGAGSGAPWQVENVGRGAAVADYDGDGNLDIALVVNGGDARLLRNDQRTGHHFARVVLRGRPGAAAPTSTVYASGALVTLAAGGVRQVRFVGGSPSYLGQSPPGEVHFGLAGAVRVDALDVAWPSGANQSFKDLPADRTLRLVEGEGAVSVDEAPEAAPASERERVVAFWDRLREATRLRVARDFAAAEKAYVAALSLDPRHEDALYYLGQCRQEQSRYVEARQAFEELVAVNDRSARGHLALGALFACSDERAAMDLSLAELHLKKAHALNGEETGPVIRLGEIAIVTGRSGEAAAWLEAGVRSNPKSVEARFLLGYLKWQVGDGAAATALLAQARQAASGDASVKGVGRTLLGEFSDAVREDAHRGTTPPAPDEAYTPVRRRVESLGPRIARSPTTEVLP